jgi:hypothetical protein
VVDATATTATATAAAAAAAGHHQVMQAVLGQAHIRLPQLCLKGHEGQHLYVQQHQHGLQLHAHPVAEGPQAL